MIVCEDVGGPVKAQITGPNDINCYQGGQNANGEEVENEGYAKESQERYRGQDICPPGLQDNNSILGDGVRLGSSCTLASICCGVEMVTCGTLKGVPHCLQNRESSWLSLSHLGHSMLTIPPVARLPQSAMGLLVVRFPFPHYNPSGGYRRAGAIVEGAGVDVAR